MVRAVLPWTWVIRCCCCWWPRAFSSRRRNRPLSPRAVEGRVVWRDNGPVRARRYRIAGQTGRLLASLVHPYEEYRGELPVDSPRHLVAGRNWQRTFLGRLSCWVSCCCLSAKVTTKALAIRSRRAWSLPRVPRRFARGLVARIHEPGTAATLGCAQGLSGEGMPTWWISRQQGRTQRHGRDHPSGWLDQRTARGRHATRTHVTFPTNLVGALIRAARESRHHQFPGKTQHCRGVEYADAVAFPESGIGQALGFLLLPAAWTS